MRMVSYLRAMLKTEVWFYLNEIELAIFDHIVADSPPLPRRSRRKHHFLLSEVRWRWLSNPELSGDQSHSEPQLRVSPLHFTKTNSSCLKTMRRPLQYPRGIRISMTVQAKSEGRMELTKFSLDPLPISWLSNSFGRIERQPLPRPPTTSFLKQKIPRSPNWVCHHLTKERKRRTVPKSPLRIKKLTHLHGTWKYFHSIWFRAKDHA